MKKLNNQLIIGIDEVGRGSLFGPVLACAVSLTKSAESLLLEKGLNDSKKLSPRKRNIIAPIIQQTSQAWGLGQASNKEIDNHGIRKATELAMIRALKKINTPIDLVLVDGTLPIRSWEGKQKTIVRGDSKFASIAAASVLAKVTRDSLITRIAIDFPGYGLEKNFGYGTKLHREGLLKLGPTTFHRKSFLSKILTV